MSNLVLPIPACATLKNRGPYYADRIDEAVSGKETRSTYWLTPRYRYTINIEALNALTRLDYQALATFFQRMQGRLSDFLITDPEDNTVTDHGFAVGDGSTASFQLQRTVGGSIVDASGYTYNAATKPYTNLLKNSSFETDSNADGIADSWSSYDNDTTVPQFLTIVPGMNGGKAQRVSWGTNASNTHGIKQTGTSSPAYVAGQWYTLSFFARASGTNLGKFIGLRWSGTAPTQTLFTNNPGLTTGWQRYVFQIFWSLGLSPTAELFLTINDSATSNTNPTNCFGDLDFDLTQVVAGQWGVNDLQAVETPAAATGTDTPAYWPSMGDGYEPVYDLNGTPTIYEDGTWRGRRQLYPYVRKNILGWSEAFDNAGWTKNSVTPTANSTTAPDGNATADTLSEGTASAIHSVVENTSPVEAQGDLRCYSVFVKATSLPNIMWRVQASDIGINFNLSTGVIDGLRGAPVASGVQTSPLWPGWFRIWFVNRVTATLGTGAVLQMAADNTYANAVYLGTSRTFFAWGAMCEIVSNANGPTPYIPTPSSAAVTVVDYALSSTGVFTPASVPGAGTVYSWDGSYYRRVRLANADLQFERIVTSMWSVSGLELVSVK